MAVSYGFYDSKNHDRKYNTIQISNIFDGLITDGVYSTIYDRFIVSEGVGFDIIVGSGRAWFNHTWTLNDAPIILSVDVPDLLRNRIDAVILEVGRDEEIRANDIKIKRGTPSQEPQKPEMVKENGIFQYPLAYITVSANSTEIKQTNIENVVGTSECPFVTGILQQITTDILIRQWEAQFEEWFNRMKDQLDTDAAGHLQNEIDQINSDLLQLKSDLTDITWPVGSVYTSTDSTSPEILFGGTWERITSRYLYAIADSESTGAGGRSSFDITTGGTVNGTAISVAQMPSHGHTVHNHSHYTRLDWIDQVDPSKNILVGRDSRLINNENIAIVATKANGVYGEARPVIDAGTSTRGSSPGTTHSGSGQSHAHGFTGAKQTISLNPSRYGVYAWRRTA